MQLERMGGHATSSDDCLYTYTEYVRVDDDYRPKRTGRSHDPPRPMTGREQ